MTPDQNEYIARLKALYESGVLDKATYETAVSAILGTTFSAETDSGTIVQGTGHMVATGGGVNVAGNVGRDLIMGNVYHGPKTADPAEALRIYRQVLLHSSGSLPLRGVDIGASDAGGGKRPLGLANVYVDLDTTNKKYFLHVGREVEQRDPEPFSALEKVIGKEKLVLTGDPGGGKSTFVNHLAHCLAARGYTPSREPVLTAEGLPICPRHGVPMQQRNRNGDLWFSHKLVHPETGETVYCRGYASTSSPGYDILQPTAVTAEGAIQPDANRPPAGDMPQSQPPTRQPTTTTTQLAGAMTNGRVLPRPQAAAVQTAGTNITGFAQRP